MPPAGNRGSALKARDAGSEHGSKRRGRQVRLVPGIRSPIIQLNIDPAGRNYVLFQHKPNPFKVTRLG